MDPNVLRGMAVFAEVAKLKSVSKAARSLYLPKSTVSRRVSSLEADLGIKLFRRTTRKIELTDEGLEYLSRCQRIMQDAESAHEDLKGLRSQVRGHVRVAMTADFALRLQDALLRFCEDNPGLVLELDLTTRKVDPASEPCDIAVYIGPPPDSGLTACKLGEVSRHVYASPAYLSKHTTPDSPEDIAGHACILEELHSLEPATHWTLTDGERCVTAKVHGALLVNSVGLIRRLAARGAGLALLPEDLCRDDVAEGRLLRVATNWRTVPLPIYALTLSRLTPAKTRRVIDFLKQQTLAMR